MKISNGFRLLILLSSAIALSTETGWARLGETMQQCVTRYGTPIHRSKGEPGEPNLVVFEKNGFRIESRFVAGIVSLCVFKHEDGQPLLDQELSTILKNNSNGLQWKKKNDHPQTWIREDGAWAIEGYGGLAFISRPYVEALVANAALAKGL